MPQPPPHAPPPRCRASGRTDRTPRVGPARWPVRTTRGRGSAIATTLERSPTSKRRTTTPPPGSRRRPSCVSSCSRRSRAGSRRPTNRCPSARVRGGTSPAPSRGATIACTAAGRRPRRRRPSVLLDENVEAAGHELLRGRRVRRQPDRTGCWRGRRDTDGGEEFELRVRDLTTGEDLADRIRPDLLRHRLVGRRRARLLHRSRRRHAPAPGVAAPPRHAAEPTTSS